MFTPRKVTPQMVKEFIKRYTSGESTYAIAETYLLRDVTVANHLRRNGITIRSRRECQIRCTLNETVFDTYTKNSCYWLGFLFADGYANLKKNQITLRLATIDSEHVVAFRNFLESDATITTYAPRQCKHILSGESKCLTITSPHLVSKMIENGYQTHNHSQPPKQLCKSPDFWRGVVDGDGSVGYQYRGKTKRTYVRLIGGFNLMTRYAEFLKPITYPYTPVIRPEKSIFRVVVITPNANKVIQILYYPNCFGLTRKIESARQCFNNRY